LVAPFDHDTTSRRQEVKLNDENMAVSLAEIRRLCVSGEARAIRESVNVNLAEVARDINVAEATLSGWERGLHRPTGPRAVRYLRLLHQLRRAASPAWSR
jgi:DNA-binding transcriptional regulator YiaG